jgi:hypothetical protein
LIRKKDGERKILKDEKKKRERQKDRWERKRKGQRLKNNKNWNVRIDIFTTVKYNHK